MGKIFGGGGGGGSAPAPAPSTQTVTQTSIPEYARPYVETMLGQSQALTDINQNPYQNYGGERIAEFNPNQQAAFANVFNQTPASQLGDATNLAGLSGISALGMQGQAGQLGQQALGYGQAGQMYGDIGQMYGAQGAQQAQAAAQNAQRQAQMFSQGAVRTGRQSLGYGEQGAGYGAGATNLGLSAAELAAREGLGYGAQGAQYGQAATGVGRSAAEMAAQQGLGYGSAGAGYGGAAAALAPAAQQYGQGAADIGMGGLGYGALGAGFGGRGAMAAEQGFGAGEAFARQATDPNAIQAYMSPYMQNAVDAQKSEATRDYLKQLQAQKAQAVGKGAFGGSRQAIAEAEAQRNLNTQLQNIQATGTQKAFEDAQRQQQFGANLGIQGLQAGYGGLGLGLQGAGVGLSGLGTAIQGQQAGLQGLGQAGSLYGQGMQGAGVGLQGLQGALAGSSQALQGYQAGMQGAQTGLQGLQGALAGSAQGLQGFGQGIQGAQAGMQGVQGALAGYNTGLSGVGQQLGAGQLGLQGTAQGMQGATSGMQGAGYGLQGVQAATGAGQLGLQGLGQATSAASTLGQLGQTQFGQEQAILAEQQKVGAVQQAQAQQSLDLAYQDFLRQRNYPYQQLAFQSDMLRGLPLSQSAKSIYEAPPSMGSQLGGLGMTALGMYGQSGGFRAKGGMVGKGYAEGGLMAAKAYKEGGYADGGDISMMNVKQLTEMLDNPSLTPMEVEMVQKRIMLLNRMGKNPTTAEIMSRGAGIDFIPTGDMVPEEGMAGGGIVAFAKGGKSDDDYQKFLENQVRQSIERQMGDNAFSKSEAEKAKLEQVLAARQERAPYEALTMAGLGTLAGTSQYGLTNLGLGATEGLKSYSRSQTADAANRQKMLEQQVIADKAEDARKSNLTGQMQSTLGHMYNKQATLAAAEANKSRAGADAQERNLLRAAALVGSDPTIKGLQSQQEKSGYLPGSPEYNWYEQRIAERQNQIYKTVGVTAPEITPSTTPFPKPAEKPGLLDRLGKMLGGDKPAAALPMPKSKDDLVKNSVYNTARGPATWDGKQFVATGN